MAIVSAQHPIEEEADRKERKGSAGKIRRNTSMSRETGIRDKVTVNATIDVRKMTSSIRLEPVLCWGKCRG
ncbi:hypothetical protein N7501_000541 [Penicillium viridicatum]|nr:hypothetical protein N7501_000541 [Penicillium viridicatum]